MPPWTSRKRSPITTSPSRSKPSFPTRGFESDISIPWLFYREAEKRARHLKRAAVISLMLPIITACSTPDFVAIPSPASPTRTTSTWIIAHRGGAGLAPENTLASFRNGLALNADVLEMDAHLTKDGVAVIIHDPTLERTTDGTGRVADFTLAQLQTFNAAAKYAGGATERQAIPTFAQVLDLAKPTNARIEVEIKVPPQGRYPGIEQKMIDEISAHEMLNRVQISSFDFDTLKQVKAISSKTKTVALLTFDYFRGKDLYQAGASIEEMKKIGADVIAVNKELLIPALVQEAHERGLKVEVWTVDAEEEMKKFVTMGVDGIITNRPDVLKRVLGR